MDSLPPYFNTGIFNTSAFYTEKDYLTKEEADKLYLSISSGVIAYLTGITPGIGLANKALVLDSSKNITGINDLTANNSLNVVRTTNGETFISNNGTVRVALHNQSSQAHIGTTTNHGFNLQTNGTNRLLISNGGNITIPNTASGLQLDLGNTGTGLNVPNLQYQGTTVNLSYYTSITEGGAIAQKAVVLNSSKDITGLGYVSGATINATTLVSGTGCDFGSYKLNNVSADVSTLTSLTLGNFAPSKAMTLNSSAIGKFILGSTTSNSIEFYGGTSFKERVFMFRDSDDEGLTIATKAQTIQKCSPLLHLYSGYDQTGVTGTSSAEYKEVIRSEHKLVGFSDNYRSGWFHGYLLGTPAWKSSGFGYGTQFYTSLEALNIAWNSSTTSSFTSGNNLLLYNNQMSLGTTTPVGTYQLTLGTTSGKQGIYLNSTTGAGIYIKGQFGGATTGRLSLDIEDNAGNVYEYGIRGSADSPTGWYWYVAGAYKMVLTRATNSRLGINVQNPSAGIEVRNTNTVGRFTDGTCNLDIWMNTAGLFGRRCFIGPSSSDDMTFQTNNTPRMTILSDGWIGIGTETPRYPLEVANTRSGQEGNMNYYYYLGPGSSNGSTTTTPVNISIRSLGRLLINSEIDVISDFRKKENIELLNLDYCQRFVETINPKIYNYKNDPNGRHFGYIAQDLIKNQFSELIMVEVDNTSEEYIDEDGFISEANRTYTLSRSQIIAILHNVIKSNVNKIKNLDEKLDNYINTVDTITVQQRLLNKINQLEESKNELQIINNNLESRLMEQEQKNINLQSRLEIVEKWISETEVIQ